MLLQAEPDSLAEFGKGPGVGGRAKLDNFIPQQCLFFFDFVHLPLAGLGQNKGDLTNSESVIRHISDLEKETLPRKVLFVNFLAGFAFESPAVKIKVSPGRDIPAEISHKSVIHDPFPVLLAASVIDQRLPDCFKESLG